MDGEYVDGQPPHRQARRATDAACPARMGRDRRRQEPPPHRGPRPRRDAAPVPPGHQHRTRTDRTDRLDHHRHHGLTWAIDLADGPAALLITLLLHREQHLVYLPGIAVNRATDSYRGEGKTDARDAAIIADQARMRRDLRPLCPTDPLISE